MNIPNVKLNNGVEMPVEGFGVYQVPDFDECKQAVLDALDSGYRAIDTAQAYDNEEAVGAALKETDVPREDIFVTTKVWVTNYSNARASVEESLEKLGLDYIDLVLLHQPFADYYAAYRDLEALYKEGKIRAIGVSNFYPDRLIDLINNVEVTPAVDQVETHVFNQQVEAQKYMEKYGVQIESWGPFAEGKNHLFTDPTLTEIGQKYGKSAAQVALRYLVQRNVVIIPKSVHKERMQQNLDIFDFELTSDDMDKILALDTKKPLFMDHEAPETVEMFMSWMK
jgi:diketogulonate reductase-like aldo/keto reductase